MFILFGSNSAKAELEPNFLEVLVEARKGQDGSQYMIYYLENEIAKGNTTHLALKSSLKEFKTLKTKGCMSTISRIESEIKEKPTMAVNLISDLNENLIDCELSYEQAGLNPEEIKLWEKEGLAVWALVAFNEYKATKNPVSLALYKKYMRWGELTLNDLELSAEDTMILASLK